MHKPSKVKLVEYRYDKEPKFAPINRKKYVPPKYLTASLSRTAFALRGTKAAPTAAICARASRRLASRAVEVLGAAGLVKAAATLRKRGKKEFKC